MMRIAFTRLHAWLYVALLSAVCLLSAWAISLATPLPNDGEFNVLSWQFRHVPDKWLYLTGRWLGGDLSEDERNDLLGRYLLITAQIQELEGTDPGANVALVALVDERDELENDVEAIIESRLTAVLEDAGLESSFPLFPGARWVFPPVDMELGQPPRSLAVSPRDRIELVELQRLRPDVDRDRAIELETEVERDGDVSALVIGLAGFSTYPSLIVPSSDYLTLVSTVAHEWVHHFLAFKPLGMRYNSSRELQTLNETVSDVAGERLAMLFVERYPLLPDIAVELEALARPEPTIDVDRELRQLRLDIEELLNAGEIDDAEALMERRRLELEDDGVFFRRINQAFFASRSIYGTDPTALSPLGENVLALFGRTAFVGPFLRAAAGLTSADDLDELLAELPSPPLVVDAVPPMGGEE